MPELIPITDNAIIMGLLAIILGVIFVSGASERTFWKRFYKFAPMVLMCYFVPSLLTLSGLVELPDDSLYYVATRYLLPAALILLTLSIDLRAIVGLGPKALGMFLAGTFGVIIGGPIALAIVAAVKPEWVMGSGDEAVWRGLSTVAGSWIGGGANQAAMQVTFAPSQSLFVTMVTVDVLVAELWMLFLLLGVDRAAAIDRLFKADASSIETLKERAIEIERQNRRHVTTPDLMLMLAVAFGGGGIAKWFGDAIGQSMDQIPWAMRLSLNSGFFWLIVLATVFGVSVSFTPVRRLEGAGASKLGTVFIFILIAVIGLKMDVSEIRHHVGLFAVGLIWMVIHVAIMVLAAWLMRAPYFFLAVGSKANIGGAASAPVVAAAFHPSLAPVAVLLAVLGYVLGTFGAYACALMMQAVSSG